MGAGGVSREMRLVATCAAPSSTTPWAPTRADLEILAGWVREGRLRSVIDSEFALDDIGAAHARSQTLRARGKIVIRVKD